MSRAGAGAPPGGSTTATGGGDVSGKLFPPADDLVGLEGGLVLVGVGICVAPLRILYTLITNLHSYAPATWSQLTTPGYSSYNALWAPALLIELVGNLTLLVFFILLIFLFFRRKKQFPVVFVWVAIFGIVMLVFVYLMPTGVAGAVRLLLARAGKKRDNPPFPTEETS